MDRNIVVKRFAELGHETRLAVFLLLVKAGRDGLPVGELQKHLGITGPTLSHHLHRLIHVGLVVQEREGRTLHCFAQLTAMRDVMQFLEEECCTL